MSKIKDEVLQALAQSGFSVTEQADGTFYVDDVASGAQAEVVALNDSLRVSATLFPTAEIQNPTAFNDAILRLVPFLSLTTVGIITKNNTDYYVAYGSISSQSAPSQVVEELTVLFDNIPQLIEFAVESNNSQE